MIGKNEQSEDDNTRVRIISEKKKLLQDTSAKVQEEVRICFEQLSNVLRTREKQLLRQVQAVHNQQLSMLQTNWEFLPSIPTFKVHSSKQQNLKDSILNFGELLLSDRKSIAVCDAEPYKIAEYVEANRDHISFDKSIKLEEEEAIVESTETLDSFPDSPCELSLNASSEADITLENEITVIMNHDYSSSSDGQIDNQDLPELLSKTKHGNTSEEKIKAEIVEDSLYSRDITNNKYTQEVEISDETFQGQNKDCNVPEVKDHSIIEKHDFFTDENDGIPLENGEMYLRSSTDSGLPLEIEGKNGDIQTNKKTHDCEEHPKQIQQWLQQILVETETEPTIHEIEQFAEISKSRFKELQFPLET